jgi:hypothetical protein
MDTTVRRSAKIIVSLMRKAGPYLLLEILLPGGTLFALLLFLYQRRRHPGAANVPQAGLVIARAIEGARVKLASVARPFGIVASAWRGRHPERDGLEALAIGPAA